MPPRSGGLRGPMQYWRVVWGCHHALGSTPASVSPSRGGSRSWGGGFSPRSSHLLRLLRGDGRWGQCPGGGSVTRRTWPPQTPTPNPPAAGPRGGPRPPPLRRGGAAGVPAPCVGSDPPRGKGGHAGTRLPPPSFYREKGKIPATPPGAPRPPNPRLPSHPFFFFPCFSPLCLFFQTPSPKPRGLFIFSSQLKMKEEGKEIKKKKN